MQDPNLTDNNGHLATIARDAKELVTVSPEIAPSGVLVPFDRAESMLFKPTTPTEFLPSTRQWVNVGGMVAVGMFGAAVALSATLKYKVTIQAPANIRPAGELRLVQSTIEGSVLTIDITENQTVRKGDIIATVKDLRLESKLKTKRNQLFGEMQKDRSHIKAIDLQIAAFDRQTAAETEQNRRTIAGIQSEFTRAEREYRDKQITTQAEVAEAEANWRTAQKERQAAEIELQVVTANLKSIQAGYQSAAARLQRYQQAAATGAISTNQLEETQLAAQQQLQSISAQSATIVKQQQIVARAAEAVAASAARVQRIKASLNPIPSESATIAQKIASQQAHGKAAISKLQQERQKLLQQRVEIIDRLAATDREIVQIATELQPTVLRAPIAGTIQDLNLRNNSQVVHPGDRIAQIVPTAMPLDIKAAVNSADIDNVKVGQPVMMRVSACPHADYGVVSGRVSQIAADAKSNPSNNPDRQSPTPASGIYEVTIKSPTRTLTQGNKKCQIRSGMDGRADIVTKEETVLQFMLRKARIFG